MIMKKFIAATLFIAYAVFFGCLSIMPANAADSDQVSPCHQKSSNLSSCCFGVADVLQGEASIISDVSFDATDTEATNDAFYIAYQYFPKDDGGTYNNYEPPPDTSPKEIKLTTALRC